MKNYITGIMSIIAGIINVVVLFILVLPSNPQAVWSLYFFFFVPGIVGLLPIPLSIFNISIEKRAFINALCFFVSSILWVFFGLVFLRLGIVFPLLLLSILGLIITKRNKILSKEGLRLIALVMIVLILVPYSLLSLFGVVAYGKTIVQNTSNVEEANALTIAENINYSNIFDLKRFNTNDHNENIYCDKTYLYYTWANFIDAKVIEYYDNRFENLKVGPMSAMKPRSINFHYEANVFTREQIRVVYVPAPKDNIYADAIQILSSNGSVLFEIKRPGQEKLCAYRNDSGYQRIGYSTEYPMMRVKELNFSLSKSYIIEMKLEYEENWNPLAGFITNVYQIIIVDENFEPFLVCVQSTGAIS